jgi:hypothetical protein
MIESKKYIKIIKKILQQVQYKKLHLLIPIMEIEIKVIINLISRKIILKIIRKYHTILIEIVPVK